MIHFIEFIGQDDNPVWQRADDISTFVVSTVNHKGKPPIMLIYLLLRNNNRVAVKGETPDSIREKLYSATGAQVTFHAIPADERPVYDDEPEFEAA